MEIREAIELIEGIAKSIEREPGQFNFVTTITGTRATSIGGGTGLHVQVTGGGSGSRTIGYQSNVGGADIEIAKRRADDAVSKQMSALVEVLNNLIVELRSVKPDKGRIDSILTSLSETWVPNVITSVIAGVITKLALG